MTPKRNYRVLTLRMSSEELEACSRTAALTPGLSRNEWMLAALDSASGLEEWPEEFRLGELQELEEGIPRTSRSQRIPIRLGPSWNDDAPNVRLGYWRHAAKRAHLPLSTWASIVLNSYSGISDLVYHLPTAVMLSGHDPEPLRSQEP